MKTINNKTLKIYMERVYWKESSKIAKTAERLRQFCEDNRIQLCAEGAMHLRLLNEDGEEEQYGKLVESDTYEPLYAWPNGIEYRIATPEV